MVAVKLTDVDITGVLSIHVVGPGLSQLEELTKQIEERYASQPAAPVEVTVDGVYCNEYSMDHCWYRVRVMKELSSEQVLINSKLRVHVHIFSMYCNVHVHVHVYMCMFIEFTVDVMWGPDVGETVLVQYMYMYIQCIQYIVL